MKSLRCRNQKRNNSKGGKESEVTQVIYLTTKYLFLKVYLTIFAIYALPLAKILVLATTLTWITAPSNVKCPYCSGAVIQNNCGLGNSTKNGSDYALISDATARDGLTVGTFVATAMGVFNACFFLLGPMGPEEFENVERFGQASGINLFFQFGVYAVAFFKLNICIELAVSILLSGAIEVLCIVAVWMTLRSKCVSQLVDSNTVCNGKEKM